MDASPNWPRNRLLLALPSRNLKRLMPELEQIRCQRAQVLMNADSSLDHVFFPDSGVVSVVAVYADGSSQWPPLDLPLPKPSLSLASRRQWVVDRHRRVPAGP
jgi:hypothetical protein